MIEEINKMISNLNINQDEDKEFIEILYNLLLINKKRR